MVGGWAQADKVMDVTQMEVSIALEVVKIDQQGDKTQNGVHRPTVPHKIQQKAPCTKHFTCTPSRTRISAERGGDETYGPIVFYVLPGDAVTRIRTSFVKVG